MSYQEKKQEIRNRAIEWQHNFSDRVMSWGEVAAETAEFERLGRRYGLLREFRENGIC